MLSGRKAVTYDKDDIIQEPNVRLKQLIDSSAVQIDPSIPIRRYYRSGQEMIRMAVTYNEEGSLESAYTLYLKYVSLFLEEILKHPEYSSFKSEQKIQNRKKCSSVLDIAEKIKSKLVQRYTEEYDKFLANQVFLENQLRQRHEQEERERKQLAEAERIREAEAEARRNITAHGPQVPPSPPLHELPSDPVPSKLASCELYPSVEDSFYPAALLPSAPELVTPVAPASASVPHVPSRALKPQDRSVPQVDRSSKPASLLCGGDAALRRIRVPRQLVTRFLALAEANTASNTETCGVLAGSMRQGELHATHLLLPQQRGTADSCTTTCEEELFEAQDRHDVLTLGWIHTHPSQTAFLSSVDLHTHCSYQLMMPEAVALVCAPKHNHTAAFMLTPDHGLNYIASCTQTGFHPHPAHPPLFTEALHVVMEEDGVVEVVDLRR